MFGWRKAALAALLATAACSRATSPQNDAAASVQGFLEAVQTGDADGFEAAIDRPAIRADLRRQLAAVGRDKSLDLDGGPSNAALDRMIDPAAFRLVDAGGAPLSGVPSKAQTAALIKPTSKDHVCLHELTPAATCLLSFAHEPETHEPDANAPAGESPVGKTPVGKTPVGKTPVGKTRPAAWRLVQMPAQALTIVVGPEPAPAK